MAATNSPNRYNDEDLNVADKDFQSIVDRPDMRALDEQGNAAIRDHEAGAGDAKPEGKDVGNLGRAESRAASTPRNNFYNPSRGNASKGGGTFGAIKGAFTGKNGKRNIALGGGIGGGAIGITLLILSLLPFKLPGLMDIISHEAGQRVEQIAERRAKQIIARAILTKMGVKAGGGYIVTGNGPLHDLYASMRTAKFEKKLEAKGIKIQDLGRDRGVRVTINNEAIGDGDIRTDREMLEALDGHRVTNRIIKDLVKEEIPSWRWVKRAKFAKWLRLKYNIPRYGIENDQNPDEDERVAEMQKGRLKTSYERITKNVMDVFDCVMGESNCPAGQNAERPDNGKAPDNAIDESDITETANELLEEETSNRKFFAKLHAKLLDTVLGKLATKAIPIIGWIDLAATVDHIIYEFGNNDYLATLPAYYRGLAYGQIFGEWAGYGDQVKLGAMDPAFIAVLAAQADGAEESQAFNYINGDSTRGKPIEQKVNNCDDCKSSINDEWETYKELIGDTMAGSTGLIRCSPGEKGLDPSDACISSHEVLNAYYHTIGGGGLLGWLSGVVGDAGSWAMGKIIDLLPGLPFEDWLTNKMKQVMKFVLETFGLYVDPLDTGADLFNNMHAGATVTFNDFCEESGCRKLTPEQTGMVNSQIAAERDEYLRGQSLGYRLFSPENTQSITTQLAISIPTAPQNDIAGSVNAFADLVASAPAKLFSTVLPTASADTKYVDLYGVDPYGALPSDLNNDISEELLEGEECPEVSEGGYNNCKVDAMIAEAMICEFQPESPECSDVDQPSSGEATSFVVGSYNILHSRDHTSDSRQVGGCNANPVPSDPTCAKTRTDRQIEIVTGKAGNTAFDIFGTQETSPEQYRLLKEGLSGYDVFPNDSSRMNNNEDGAVAVWWNKSKFRLLESGKAPGVSNTSKNITNPWVALQSNGNTRKIYVMSIHYAIRAFGGDDSVERASRLTMDWVREHATGDNIVIVVGDFNNMFRVQRAYCIYTQNGLMQHAEDMQQNKNPGGACNDLGASGIDHIYATPKEDLEVSGWTHAPNTGIYSRSSDHTPVYATFSFGGTESAGGGVRDWSWPLAKKWWTTYRSDWLSPHGMSSGTFTSPYAIGVASDISNPPDNSPVYSMLPGTVTRADACAIIVESTVPQGTLYIAYGHSDNHKVKVGDKVTSGQQLSELASTCNSTGGHLHIDMAIGGKHVCPQDVFLAMDKGQVPKLNPGSAPCGR